MVTIYHILIIFIHYCRAKNPQFKCFVILDYWILLIIFGCLGFGLIYPEMVDTWGWFIYGQSHRSINSKYDPSLGCKIHRVLRCQPSC
jgi:hypothetical protein